MPGAVDHCCAGGRLRRGQRCDALVELVDLFPTLSELCSLSIPEQLDGISLAPLLRDPKRSWKKTAFSVAKRGDIMGRSVRTEHAEQQKVI